MIWYSAKLLFRCFIDDAPDPSGLEEESVRVLTATSIHDAIERAGVLAREAEAHYANQQQEAVTWRFVELLEIQDLAEETLGDGTEVFSTLRRRHGDTLTDADLARIQDLCDSATPGPWKAFIEGRDHEAGASFIQTSAADIELQGASHADHDFIAHARKDVPRLLEEVRALRQRLARLGAG